MRSSRDNPKYNIVKIGHNSEEGSRVEETSLSSCRAASTDIPDPLSQLLPIIHRFWQVYRATSRIFT